MREWTDSAKLQDIDTSLHVYIALIMDCCHSGSVTRDPFSERVRAAPTDHRSLGAWAAAGGSDFPPENEVERAGTGVAAWIAGRRQAVVLAACQAREFAWEHRWWDGTDVQYGGAFTFFLRETLAAAPSDATWRSIFEPLMVSLTREYPRQHPLAEGKVDEILFGRDQLLPAPYLPILEVRHREAILGGGLAHGVHLGSRWEVVGSTESEDRTTASSILKVTGIKPTRCLACCESEPARTLSAGQRARLIEDVVDTALALELPTGDDFAVRQLVELIRQEPLLAISSDRRTAEIRIRRIPARQTVHEGDPPRPLPGPSDLPGGTRRGRDRPHSGRHFSVCDYFAGDPSLTDHVREGLRLHLPDGFPWSASSLRTSLGMIYLKLLVTIVPADFGFLRQQGARPAEHAIPKHPLARLVARCAWGSSTRSFAPIPSHGDRLVDWATESLVVGVRR